MLGFRPVASAPLASGPLAEDVAAQQQAQGRFDFDLWERKQKRIQVVDLTASDHSSDHFRVAISVEPLKPLPARPAPPEVDLPIFDETFVSDLLLGRLPQPQEEPKPGAVRRLPVVNAKGFTEALAKGSQPAFRSRKSRLPQRPPGTRRRIGQKVH